ncbi:hippurate hydrolase [Plectosphaerella cucumerina]|uniref:Hippurate hydrolase n=1 Tax=Plectosphaerella cucumerina TaxID=40658 RepID=A0A8K0X422_9PEZI|nr:hippurate hydrolase [Plectosphaerella cucumerina]
MRTASVNQTYRPVLDSAFNQLELIARKETDVAGAVDRAIVLDGLRELRQRLRRRVRLDDFECLAHDEWMDEGILKDYAPDYSVYEDLYKHFHANAELPWQEQQTAAKVAQTLRSLSPDLEITTGIGGHGLIAILRNGDGPTVLLRADMDGLPVKELTGLDYACHNTMPDADGTIQPVMHACGHDMHITALLAAADVLVRSRPEWSGTIVLLFQPAEEKSTGAKAMVDAGLFTSLGCPVPDVILGQHVFPAKAGTLSTCAGPIMAGTAGLLVTVYGRGGHGSSPHLTVDPVVLASHIVVRLQTIVSRETPPDDVAVVTVGAISAGSAENIISDEATLRINTRSLRPERRAAILEAIERIVRAECVASGCTREPSITPTVSTLPMDNDTKVAARVGRAFQSHFGDAFDPDMRPVPASEDFNQLAIAVERPYLFWFFGGHDPEDYERREREGTLAGIPSNHSPFFAPVLSLTLKTGTEAMVVAALSYVATDTE